MDAAHCAARATRRRTDSSADGSRQRCRIALYSHDTMGLGHMRRNMLIAQSLQRQIPNSSLLIISGARESTTFWMPEGVDCLSLPALSKQGPGQYGARTLGLSLPEMIRLRGQTILSAVREFQPDVFVVDNVPRGAVAELDPTLEYLKKRETTRCVLGLRDVLDEPAAVRKEWTAAANLQAVRRFYDAVWVYGDPRVYDLITEYRWPCDLADKVSFTGYFDHQLRMVPEADEESAAAATLPANGPLALCMVGGGQDGVALAEAFAQAPLPPRMSGLLVLGPYMPTAARQRVHHQASENDRLQALDFHHEPTALLRRADRVIAMGGYNTTYEVLSFDKQALIVPRVEPRREQWIRAERLRSLGLLEVLHPNRVAPESVGRWLAREPQPPPAARTRIDFQAAERLPRLLAGLLSNRSTSPALSATLSPALVGSQ